MFVAKAVAERPRVDKAEGHSWTDLAGSSEHSSVPIISGVWSLEDLDGGVDEIVAEWDEIKYVLTGEACWKNLDTGEESTVTPGDLIWLPKGCRTVVTRCKDFSAFYVEQTFRPLADHPAKPCISSERLQILSEKVIKQFAEDNKQSAQQFENARKYLPGGNTRSVLYYEPFPITMVSGRECYVTSMDGREYLDLVSEYSAAFFGHSHPRILKAIQEVFSGGIGLGAPGKNEIELAKSIIDRIPSIEKVRFCNSGTEATAMALGIAMNYTKKKKVLVFQNGYHGGLISFPTGASSTMNAPFDFVIGQYNNVQDTEKLINEEIAAILVEPLQGAGGMIPASKDFLASLRSGASKVGAVLIFDEIITSRLHFNGLQEYHGIYPDMTTLGKYLGGGFSFGAFGGRDEIMAVLDPSSGLSHSGTYNNNVFSMAAGVAASHILTKTLIDETNSLGDELRRKMAKIFEDLKIPIEVTGFGSVIGVHYGGDSPAKLRDAFFFYLLQNGIYIGKRGFISFNTVHEAKHVEQVLDVVRRFAHEISDGS